MPTHLRIATFNIHSGIGTDDRVDLTRTAKLLAPYDFAALQEVSGDKPWRNNAAAKLGDLLDIDSLFAPTETHWWFPVFGNGALTRCLITHWARTPLPCGYHMAHRSVVSYLIPFGHENLTVLAVHLGKKSDRQRQFLIATTMFKQLPMPAVMMGDFNTRPYDQMMQDLLRSGDVQDVVGQHIAPRDRVDFILTRGVNCSDAGLVDNDASDHPLAWANLEAR